MRVIQGYTCTYGIQPELNATGNQAICVECTAYPMLTGRLNLSMLCSGTRFFAGWKSSEAAVGIPYSQLEGTVRGLRDTVNGTEMDDRKKEIIAGLKELGESTDDIAMQSAYYLITAREKAAKIKR